MRKFLIVFLIISHTLFSSYNSYGQVGYINTPSAYNTPEASLSLILSRNKPDRKIIINGSPFDWLDANIFYVDVTRVPYGNGFQQSYKDKGFSIKLTKKSFLGHTFAIGGNDIAGTGIYNSEYIVASSQMNRFEYSFGMGWGNYSNGIKLNNPFIMINKSFKSRSLNLKSRGGDFDLNNYFSGKKASLFFGSSYQIDKRNKLILEFDPTKTEIERPGWIEIPFKKSKTKLNIGYEYSFKDFSIKLALIRGMNLNVILSVNDNYLDFKSNPNPVFSSETNTYQELQRILDLNKIGLKAIYKNEDQLKIVARQNTYQNQYEPNRVILYNVKPMSDGIEEIIISYEYLNMNTYESSFQNKSSINFRNEQFHSQGRTPNHVDYIVKDNFPIISNNLGLKVRNFIASREGFYFGGLLLENNNEIILRENFILLSNLKTSLYDDFNKLYIPPKDVYPNQVRSDIKQYLNNIGNKVTIGRFEANYFSSFNRKHFFRYSAGIFEEMFGGYGFDYVYYPEGSLFSFGFEAYHLRKREYSQNFQFLPYRNNISRFSLHAVDPKTKINFNISYGEYIAGDRGYTLQASRRYENGVEFGIFFTKTNVPLELYGEGSFDKGIKLRIPFYSIFQRKRNLFLSEYEWHPLTKDPGALLIKSVDLREEIQRFRFY